MIGELTLNTFSTTPVVKKTRTARQDKKQELCPNPNVFDISLDETRRNFEDSQNGRKRKRREKDYDTTDFQNSNHKFNKQKNLVTSLFGGNPEVPKLPRKGKMNDGKALSLFSDLTFENAGIHPFMVSNLEKILEACQMTQVQRKSIPMLLTGNDVLVRSHTGSGKTLAYSVPIIQALQEERPKISRAQGVLALIIVPTRELALQTYEWLIKLVKPFQWLVPGVLSGGEKKKSEKARLRKGVTVLVSTPGRLVDHIGSTAVCSLARVRQTVLLSATLSPGVERLAGIALREERLFVDADTDEVTMEITEDAVLSVPSSLQQWAMAIPAKLRLVALTAFIAAKCELTEERKILVFCATQDMVDYLTPLLATCLATQDSTEETEEEDSDGEVESGEANLNVKIKTDIKFFRLHGSMGQKDRMEVFKTFRDSSSGVLICTDVASRGLDLPQVDWIVQFTAPQTVQDYVHRVGRTARVGAKGSALIFLAPSETAYVSQLHKHGIHIKEMNAEKVLDSLLDLVPCFSKQRKHSRRKVWKPTVEAVATALQIQYEKLVMNDMTLHELACKAYVSFVRFYASFPKVPDQCFHYKALHLGHYAKSFALRDPPSSIGGIGKRSWERTREQNRHHYNAKPDRTRTAKKTTGKPTKDRTKELLISEYASGL
ncbi:hypothetical protein B566_EDAN003548 [Ephemera danica]|nr:hypothetical protein B566_EDAN003548 [Ephemera danica]